MAKMVESLIIKTLYRHSSCPSHYLEDLQFAIHTNETFVTSLRKMLVLRWLRIFFILDFATYISKFLPIQLLSSLHPVDTLHDHSSVQLTLLQPNQITIQIRDARIKAQHQKPSRQTWQEKGAFKLKRGMTRANGSE